MQLEGARRVSSLRGRLSAAACIMLASSPAVARSETPASATPSTTPSTQVDATALLYGEKGRARVVEPMLRVTRLFTNGQSLSATLGLDVITGASPSGAMPPGRVQTTTSASGNTIMIPANQLPVTSFKDNRASLDLEWQKPWGALLTSTTGAHVSREKDYQSLGASGTFALDLIHHRTTITAGAGINEDRVFPVGGTRVGLSDGTSFLNKSGDSKRVGNALVGLSQVISRRWMMGVNYSRAVEDGYLTEPYKVVSLIDDPEGVTTGQLTEKRPSTRHRTSVLANSVYHLTEDVVYLSYRRYRDDWGLRSHMFDAKYRKELGEEAYLQPHVRYYSQTAADFFTFGLVDGAPLPKYASSDYRLGPLRTLTVGATYGFHVSQAPGELSVRAEILRQFGDGHPPGAKGVQRGFDLFPALNIGTLMLGYSVDF